MPRGMADQLGLRRTREFSHRWLLGVLNQRRRWWVDHETGYNDLGFVDAHLFANCLFNLRKAAVLALRQTGSDQIRRALARFDQALPHAKNVRDLQEHFEAYAEGQGVLQKQGLVGAFVTETSSTAVYSTRVNTGGFTYETKTAEMAARALHKDVMAVLNKLIPQEGS